MTMSSPERAEVFETDVSIAVSHSFAQLSTVPEFTNSDKNPNKIDGDCRVSHPAIIDRQTKSRDKILALSKSPACFDLSHLGVNVPKISARVAGKSLSEGIPFQRIADGLRDRVKRRPMVDGQILGPIISVVPELNSRFGIVEKIKKIPPSIAYTPLSRRSTDMPVGESETADRLPPRLATGLSHISDLWSKPFFTGERGQAVERGGFLTRVLSQGNRADHDLLNIPGSANEVDAMEYLIMYALLAQRGAGLAISLSGNTSEEMSNMAGESFRAADYYLHRFGHMAEVLLKDGYQDGTLSKKYRHASPSAIFFKKRNADKETVKQYINNVLFLLISADYIVPLEATRYDLEILAEEIDLFDEFKNDFEVIKYGGQLQSLYFQQIEPETLRTAQVPRSFWRDLVEMRERLGRPLIGIDLGCGSGIFAQAAAQREDVGQMLAFDVASGSDESRSENFGLGKGKFIEISTKDKNEVQIFEEALRLLDEELGTVQADFLIVSNVIHHLPEQYRWRYLFEFIKRLAPGGKLFLQDAVHSEAIDEGSRKIHVYDTTPFKMVTFEELETIILILRLKGFDFAKTDCAIRPGAVAGTDDGFQREVAIGSKPDGPKTMLLQSPQDVPEGKLSWPNDIFKIEPFAQITESDRNSFMNLLSPFVDCITKKAPAQAIKAFLSKFGNYKKLMSDAAKEAPISPQLFAAIEEKFGLIIDDELQDRAKTVCEFYAVQKVLLEKGINIRLNGYPGWERLA